MSAIQFRAWPLQPRRFSAQLTFFSTQDRNPGQQLNVDLRSPFLSLKKFFEIKPVDKWEWSIPSSAAKDSGAT